MADAVKVTHTPGPWSLATGHSNFQVHGPDGLFVADVLTLNRHAAECEANALIIAAAPELLEALDGMMRLGPHAGIRQWRDAMRKAETAVAKADGQS